MRLFQVTAEIEDNGYLSKKLFYAGDREKAVNKFYDKVDRSGNIDRSKYSIVAVNNHTAEELTVTPKIKKEPASKSRPAGV